MKRIIISFVFMAFISSSALAYEIESEKIQISYNGSQSKAIIYFTPEELEDIVSIAQLVINVKNDGTFVNHTNYILDNEKPGKKPFTNYTFDAGVYTCGEDFPPGTYSIDSTAIADHAYIYNENGKSIGIYQLGYQLGSKVGKFKFKKGYTVNFNYSGAIMTRLDDNQSAKKR